MTETVIFAKSLPSSVVAAHTLASGEPQRPVAGLKDSPEDLIIDQTVGRSPGLPQLRAALCGG